MRYFMGLLSFLFGINSNNAAFADSSKFVVIDVRTPQEYAEKHVLGSKNIDVMDAGFLQKIETLDKNQTYKVYCRSGNRSGRAESIMKSRGFKDVENLGSLQQAARRLQKPYEGKDID